MCELLATRKERNDYLFDFYLDRVSLNAFMAILRSPDLNVDAILLEYIEAEIAALHVRVKRRRKTSPKRLTSPKKEAVVEGELRDFLKKPRTIPIITLPSFQERDTAPVAGSSIIPMTLPVSLPPTTEPITPTTDVCRAAPTILEKCRAAVTSTVTSYKLPIPSAAAAPPQPPRLLPPPPPYALPPCITAETLAAATNGTFSVETPNAVIFCEWVPASLHTDQPSGPTLRVDGGKTSMPIVGCHFISESGVLAVYKLKELDNNFVNLKAFCRIITHYRAALRGAFGEMFSPWSSSKLIVPFELI